MRLTRRTTILSAMALAACGQSEPKTDAPAMTNNEPKESEGRIAVTGGSVAWRRIGGGGGTPLLCLHGGPGVPSDYLETLGGLGDERPVYFYDQLGVGRSDHPTDPSLWTIDRYVEELGQVREALGLRQLHLLGQSWGSMLAVEYLLRKGEEGVRSVVFAGPVMKAQRYADDARRFISELTPEQQAAVAEAERTGKFDDPAYIDADNAFIAMHLARSPAPEAAPLLEKAMSGINQDIYVLMNGPSEFSLLGTLKDFDRTADLGKLSLPILFLSGEYDPATPAAARDYAAACKNADVAVISGAGHLTTIDDPRATNDAVRAFLKKAETA